MSAPGNSAILRPMHKAALSPTLFLAVLLALAACPALAEAAKPGQEANVVEGVVAKVGGEPVTMQEVMDDVRSELLRRGKAGGDEPTMAEMQRLYRESLEEHVRRKLVLRAYRDSEMSLPEWMVDKRVSEIIDSRYGGDREKLLDELADNHITFSEWRTQMEEGMIVLAMRQLNVEKNVHVGPSAVRDYYHAHEADFVRKSGVHLYLIRIKRKDGETPEQHAARAAALRTRIDHEPFEEIARYFSDDPSAKKGGDWGWLKPEEELREELVACLAKLSVGETSPLVETSGGYYILRKDGERADGLQPIEAVRDEIDGILRKAEAERLFREWTDGLRAKADIRILRPML